MEGGLRHHNDVQHDRSQRALCTLRGPLHTRRGRHSDYLILQTPGRSASSVTGRQPGWRGSHELISADLREALSHPYWELAGLPWGDKWARPPTAVLEHGPDPHQHT